MAQPLRVAVRRGEIVECVHAVHAVAVQDGSVVAAAGDPALAASLRSSAKPLQALPLARAYENLSEDELAIAAASHFGTPEHVEVVRRLLAVTGGSEEELDCGLQAGRPPEPIFHNCSGKHAGMIAVCRANGWPVEGYRRPDHPLQHELLDEIAGAAEVETERGSKRRQSRPQRPRVAVRDLDRETDSAGGDGAHQALCPGLRQPVGLGSHQLGVGGALAADQHRVGPHCGRDASAAVELREPREHGGGLLERKPEADDAAAVQAGRDLAGLDLGGTGDLIEQR